MKGLFDTSVLVPVFYGNHVHHRASLDLFIQFDKSQPAWPASRIGSSLQANKR
jgi:hypothetical protein